MRKHGLWSLVVLMMVLGACKTGEHRETQERADEQLSRGEAALLLATEGMEYDPCEAYGWYGDGVCDEFCPGSDPDCEKEEMFCAQVIVYGTHPETGECRQFSTPCDVPEGWEVSYEGCPEEGDQESRGEAGECESDDDCFVGGCSGQVCSSDEEVMTTCEWREEYGCYQDREVTRCGCFEGKCGWEQTPELEQCLSQ